jgi:NADPH:quinone reductase-like Zn-dependent oxidoreductase
MIMKAVVYNKKASPSGLLYCDVEKPVPADDEVLVEISCVSLNAADYRSMKLGIIPKRKIFGADISGRVESVGKNVTLFKPGDKVMGDLAGFGFGGFAEYTTAPERAIILMPEMVSFEEAASVPLAGVTALQALRTMGNIEKGQKVLIVGSAGGVGTYAVQLALHFGAEVTGVCSTRNVQQTANLGAHRVIDYTKESIFKTGQRYDLILAINGNYSLFGYSRILNPGGRVVVVGGTLSQIFRTFLLGWLLSLGSRKIGVLSAKPNKSDLEFLAGLLSDGKIKPVIERRYTLDKTADAMNYLSGWHASGKVVINVKTSD